MSKKSQKTKTRDSSGFSIRQLRVSDISRVCKIEAESFVFPLRKYIYQLFYNREPNGCLVATINGRVAGYIIAHTCIKFSFRKMTIQKEGFIDYIAVDPNYRRKGIGRELMKTIFLYFRKKKVKCIALEVEANNKKAINFYLKLGFNISKHKFVCGREILIMRKVLDNNDI